MAIFDLVRGDFLPLIGDLCEGVVFRLDEEVASLVFISPLILLLGEFKPSFSSLNFPEILRTGTFLVEDR